MKSRPVERSRWQSATRTVGVLAVLVMLLALAVGTSMAAGDAPTGVDAPLGKSSLGDTVFHDQNVNGLEDGGEPGIPGVIVNLYKDNKVSGNIGVIEPGELISTTVTDGVGYYDFPVDGDETYWAVLDPTNFNPGGALEDYVFTTGSTIVGSMVTPEGIAVEKSMPLAQLDYNDADFGLVKVDLRISISPINATNVVGDPHVFTVTVESKVGSGAWTPVSGATPSVSYSPTPSTPGSSPVNCGPTNASGQCTVTINSAVPGVFTASATVTANVNVPVPDGLGGSTPTPVSRTRTTGAANNTAAGGSGIATKTYVDLRILLSPLTATNAVGQPHTFTATVQQNDGSGSGWVNVPNGTGVNFSMASNTAGASFTAGTSCTTSGGQCTTTINGTQAGTVVMSATTTATVGGLSITRTTSTTPNTNAGGSTNATKTYVDLRILLSPLTATNVVGQPHTFTATVQQNTGGGWTSVPNGTAVSFSLLSNTAGANFTAGSSCTTTSGQCTITINGTQSGSVTVHATTTATVSGLSITRATSTAANTAAGGTTDATKTYVDMRILLSPLTATNAVGQPHTFTATVQQNTGSGWVSVPNGTTVSFSLLNNTAAGAFTAGNTCTTSGGVCTITINGTQAGAVDVNATATATVGGVSITRSTSTAANTAAGGSTNATKTYVDMRIILSPLTPTNAVGQPHTFTATVQQNTGSGWISVPNGTAVNFSIVTNTANGSFTAGSTCTTTSGQCNITITGTQAGTVTVNATATATVSGQTVTRATSTAANTAAGGSTNATKTYVDLRIILSPLAATNTVGQPHTFTATVQQNTGGGWSNVTNGTTVNFSLLANTANGSFTAGTSCTTTSGQCTITINGTQAGSVTVHATTTATVSGQTITRATSTAANTAAGGSTDATKTYVGGALGDIVWWDINKNGTQDGSEPGIAGVTIYLYNTADGSGSPLNVTTTDASGYYTFTGLGAGTYSVRIDSTEFLSGQTLENWVASPQNVGSDTTDSDGDPTTHLIQNIPLNPASGGLLQYNPTNDFGFFKASGYTVSKVRVTDPDDTGIRIGDPISFTITVVNTGTTWLTTVPISDSYNLLYLQFSSANIGGVNTPPNAAPPPTGVMQTLQWNDITGAGSLAPGGSIVLTVVFVGVGDTTQLPAAAPCNVAGDTCNQVSVSTAGNTGPTADPDGPTGPLPPSEVLPPKDSEAPAKIINPTAVALADYGASIATNSVTLRWSTLNESKIVSFDVYRIDSSRTSVLVGSVSAAKPGQPSGSSYSLVDDSAVYGVSYTYMLEAQMFDGETAVQKLATTSWLWLASVVR